MSNTVHTFTHPTTGQDCVRVRLDLAYDGTDFSGWAIQPQLRTVQGELEAALQKHLRDPEIRLTVGGRTDAGVHARGQVAHCDISAQQFERWSTTRDARSEQEIASLRASRVNSVLRRSAPDISVHTVSPVPPEFDARFSALRRRYEYWIRPSGCRWDPATARTSTYYPHALNITAMNDAAQVLIGLNDFSTFCKAREGATAVRDLLRFDWEQLESGMMVATLEADAFCHSMVRALVGAVVAVGSEKLSSLEMQALQRAQQRTNRFTVMPAQGLTLTAIEYPDRQNLAIRARQTRAIRSIDSAD